MQLEAGAVKSLRTLAFVAAAFSLALFASAGTTLDQPTRAMVAADVDFVTDTAMADLLGFSADRPGGSASRPVNPDPHPFP